MVIWQVKCLEFFKSFRELTPQRRLMLISGIGVIAILFALYYPSEPEVVVAPQISPSQDAKNQIIKPIMPVGYQQGQTNQSTRDPFALPPGLQSPQGQTLPQQIASPANHSTQAVPAISGGKKDVKSGQGSNVSDIRLTGVASADGVKVAVIQSAGKSKTYQLNEAVGAYRLVGIDNDSVVLNGPGGERILRIEAASQKGGDKKNAK